MVETHERIARRAVLISRAVSWAVDALAHDDTTVSALARHLRVDWHILWRATKANATVRVARPGGYSGVNTLGVDEHIWRPGRFRPNERAVSAMVDLTRDADGRLHARLLDVVPGRSGPAYAGWLGEQPAEFIDAVEHAALDPSRGYLNAIRGELPDAVAVLDASEIVKLAPRSLTRYAPGPAGHPAAARPSRRPALQDARTVRHGHEHPTERQLTKLNSCLEAGDPDWAVTVAWSAYQHLRSAHATKGGLGREIAEKVIDSFPACPTPVVARSGGRPHELRAAPSSRSRVELTAWMHMLVLTVPAARRSEPNQPRYAN